MFLAVLRASIYQRKNQVYWTESDFYLCLYKKYYLVLFSYRSLAPLFKKGCQRILLLLVLLLVEAVKTTILITAKFVLVQENNMTFSDTVMVPPSKQTTAK